MNSLKNAVGIPVLKGGEDVNEKFPPSTVFVKTFFGTPLPSEVGAVVLVLRDARFA